MAIINTNGSFGPSDTVTSTNLNSVADAATFNDPVDDTTLELITTGANSGKLRIKANGVGTTQIAASSVTFSKLDDVIDDDTMATATATTLATSESIKAYVDGSSTQSSDGYVKLPNGVIIQWGSLTPSSRLTDVTLPIAFPNNCWNVQASIGDDFTDSQYEDNSLIWGGYPKSGDLSKITIMSNLRLSNSGVGYKKIFWQAIGN